WRAGCGFRRGCASAKRQSPGGPRPPRSSKSREKKGSVRRGRGHVGRDRRGRLRRGGGAARRGLGLGLRVRRRGRGFTLLASDERSEDENTGQGENPFHGSNSS